jgi:prevent-host-death family protein
MKKINIHEAKTHLSSLVEKAANGEEFIIAKAGKPMVKVIPYREALNVPRIGFMKGQFTVPEDFDNMNAKEISTMFEGGQ